MGSLLLVAGLSATTSDAPGVPSPAVRALAHFKPIPDDADGVCSPTASESALYQAAKAGAPSTPLTARADHFAQWVYDHSVHDGAKPHVTEDIRLVDFMAQMMLDHVSGAAEKPSMGCGHRNNILKKLLHLDGISARLVNILGHDTPDQSSYGHVLLEFEDADGQWTLVDADYLIVWTNLEGKRIGVYDAIRLPYTRLIPRNLRGERGYHLRNSEGSSPQTFVDLGLFSAAIVLTAALNDYDYVSFYLNSDKIPPDKVLEGSPHLKRFGHLPSRIF